MWIVDAHWPTHTSVEQRVGSTHCVTPVAAESTRPSSASGLSVARHSVVCQLCRIYSQPKEPLESPEPPCRYRGGYEARCGSPSAALLDVLPNELILPEESQHVVHRVVCDRLLPEIEGVVGWQQELQNRRPERSTVEAGDKGLVEEDSGGEDARRSQPCVQIGRHPLLEHRVGEHAHLEQAEHQIVATSREARDEEGLPVGKGTPRKVLAWEAQRRDEEAAASQVAGQREHARQGPLTAAAKEGSVWVGAGIHRVHGIAQDCRARLDGCCHHQRIRESMHEKPPGLLAVARLGRALVDKRADQEVVERGQQGHGGYRQHAHMLAEMCKMRTACASPQHREQAAAEWCAAVAGAPALRARCVDRDVCGRSQLSGIA
eukprot:scaffold5253_cov128-Isochrysis_galbana.AAC.2